jgi:hypothetical protein
MNLLLLRQKLLFYHLQMNCFPNKLLHLCLCMLSYSTFMNSKHSLCSSTFKKNLTHEGLAALADIILRSRGTRGLGRENPRTLASHH